MPYDSKKAWISPETRENERYLTIMNSMRRLFPKSEVAKMDKSLYLAHREAVLKDERKRLEVSLAAKLEDRRHPPIPNPLKVKDFQDCRGAILCQKTIWCAGFRQKEELAPWPSNQEMRWEGDDRAKTGVGRFLPIPREQGSAAVAWHNLRALEPFEFDIVRKIPTLEDILLPVDEIDEDVIPSLLNSDLLKALDLPEENAGSR